MSVLLSNYNDAEKGAYLTAIASIAMADHHASAEEISVLENLAEAAELSDAAKEKLLSAAKNTNPADLKENIEILRNSELRFSLLADLIAFANSDGNYSPTERAGINKITRELNINQEQYDVLNEFVEQTAAQSPAELNQPQALGLFENSGISDRLGKAGINMGGLATGLLAVVGPLLMQKFLKGKQGSSGGLGGMLGGGGGGLGDLLGGALGGGSRGGNSGGLGSLISSLSGNKGFGKTGSFLDSIFK